METNKKKFNENLMRCRRERETIEERQFFFCVFFYNYRKFGEQTIELGEKIWAN